MFEYILDDAPDYKARKAKPYVLPEATIREIHEAVPKFAHERKTVVSLFYVVRMLILGAVFWEFGINIPTLVSLLYPYGYRVQIVAKWFMWANYYWWQSMVFCGFWTLGHDAGHMSLSPHPSVSHAIGFTLHCFVLVPYYGWRYAHKRHHSGLNSVERDEHFCPATRSENSKLPPPSEKDYSKYAEVLEEAPLMTLIRLFFHQFFGLQAYMALNVSGNVSYPQGTNHYTLNSPLFRPGASSAGIVMSSVGISIVSLALGYYAYTTSIGNVFRLYGVPYFLVNHWIVGIVFLQHNDPTVPYFRGNAWTYLRGVTSTVDRPLLGWMGRFFFHNLAHDHVAHHMYGRMPFYHMPYATEAIKKVLGDSYCYDSTNFFRSLYRNFTTCQFIEDEGDVVFFRDARGVPTREIDDAVFDVLGACAARK